MPTLRKSTKIDKCYIFVLILLVLTIFCFLNDKDIINTGEECIKDSECLVSGCSSEICSSKEVITPCVWKEEYTCLQFTSCNCNDGVCGWAETEAYSECLGNLTGERITITTK